MGFCIPHDMNTDWLVSRTPRSNIGLKKHLAEEDVQDSLRAKQGHVQATSLTHCTTIRARGLLYFMELYLTVVCHVDHLCSSDRTGTWCWRFRHNLTQIRHLSRTTLTHIGNKQLWDFHRFGDPRTLLFLLSTCVKEKEKDAFRSVTVRNASNWRNSPERRGTNWRWLKMINCTN